MRGERGIVAAFLHPQPATEPHWRYLPLLLAAAFLLRAAVALSGDFVVHPDEVMQYLEQAHRLVFGAGVVYWEYFYGARSWLVPGLAAGVLWICKMVGLDSPVFYISAVKLLFCALSLLIPWGMYIFSRRHWGETAARIALLAGVFWYELAGFAHKPMTEFVATSILLALLAATPLSPKESWKKFALAGAIGALAVAVRFQYAPAAGLILLAGFWRGNANGRAAMAGGALATMAAVGLLEWLSWGAPFYSYYFNAQMNLVIGAARAGESSILQMPLWLLHASGGLILAVVYGAAKSWRRYGFVLILFLVILIPHLLQNHREYRFIFALAPLWLMVAADVLAVAATKLKDSRKLYAAAAAAFSLISVAGIFNAIPLQNAIYQSFSHETGKVNFIAGQDSMFKIYRQLSADENVRGVADFTRPYFNTGGYYYLHRAVPFYTARAWSQLADGDPADYVSHIITERETAAGDKITAARTRNGGIVQGLQTAAGVLSLPLFAAENGQLAYWNVLGQKRVLDDFAPEMKFGKTVLWKINRDKPVREWRRYEIITAGGLEQFAEKILGDSAPIPPDRYGIIFQDAANGSDASQ